jgi:hypothetical protein
MEKAVECGIRIKEADLDKNDADFEKFLSICCDRIRGLVETQRNSYLAVSYAGAAKSGGGFTPFKGIELYCKIKGEPQVFTPADKGIECGIRIKEFALELPDNAFKVYLGGCVDVFKESILQQRLAYQAARSGKSVDLDGTAKGVEFYCEVKSMCS